MIFNKALNDLSARTAGRTANTVFSILQIDPNTTAEQLLALLVAVFGIEVRSGWYEATLQHLSPATQPDGAQC